MEAQQTNPGISQLSSMNAFYGIPNTSQETAAAVKGGARAPEVYELGSNEPSAPVQNQETETNRAQANPAETYFSQPADQLDLSNQAVAMLQQAQQQVQQQDQQQTSGAPETQEPTLGVTDESTPPTPSDGDVQVPVGDGSASAREIEVEPDIVSNRPQATSTPEPTASTGLNNRPTTQTQNESPEASNQLQTAYSQFSGSGPEASSASQAGNLFSATV